MRTDVVLSYLKTLSVNAIGHVFVVSQVYIQPLIAIVCLSL